MPTMAKTTQASAARAAIGFAGNDVVLESGGGFSFRIDRTATPANARLVLDLYDLDNPIHPDGHIGWQEYDLSALPHSVSGRLSFDRWDSLHADLDALSSVDMWRNPHAPRPARIVLIAALRSSHGDLMSVAQIPVLKTAADLADFRSGFDRDYRSKRYATLPRPTPSGRGIHIVAPNIFARDAVGNLCLGLFGMLKHHNADVRVFANNFDLALNHIVEARAELADNVKSDDVLLYFFSTHDADLPELLTLPYRRKLAYFHGVTNPDLLRDFDPELAEACVGAVSQLPLLAGFDRLAANSAANAAALQHAFADAVAEIHEPIATVPPLIVGQDELRLVPPAATRGISPTTLLFVGRIVSHKRIEDVLALLVQYRQLDPSARAVIVGHVGHPAYRDHLREVQAALRLPDEAVSWRSAVASGELDDIYASASVYVSMSEDEGFCVPIFEAMCRNVPVMSFDLPAVRETLGGAGLIFSEKDFAALARRLRDLLSSPDALQTILDAQHRRAAELVAEMSGRYFLDLVTEP